MSPDFYSQLHSFFQSYANQTFTIALSGGMDSVALLHLFTRAQLDFQIQINAIHIHHGLNTHADDWQKFCEQLCAQWQIPIQIVHVQVKNQGLGIEASARQARYNAFHQYCTGFLALAHHRNDQNETLLLGLLRGGGLRSAASMPAQRHNQHLTIMRPLLAISRAQIEAYIQYFHLSHIEDDSNNNTDFTRNFIRLRLLPLIEKAIPHAHQQLYAAVKQFQNDLALLDEFTAEDMHTVCQNNIFDCIKWRSLSSLRRRNLLLYLTKQNHLGTPRRESIIDFERIIMNAHTGEWSLPFGKVYYYKNQLFILHNHFLSDLIHHPPIQWQNRLYGIDNNVLAHGFSIRKVQPHDRIAIRGGHKLVKKILQEQGIVPFMRPHWLVVVDKHDCCIGVVNVQISIDVQIINGVFPVINELMQYQTRHNNASAACAPQYTASSKTE